MNPSSFRLQRLRLVAACAALLVGTSAHAQVLEVATSFSILGDLVTQVGGERVKVRTLVGPDEDAHAFQPRPSDAREIGKAALVVVNGLGFDDWMARLARAGGFKGTMVVASEGISTLAMARDDDHGHDHGHARGKAGDAGKAVDPHAWQDVTNVRRYVANITAALAKADPEGAGIYQANAERYDGELKALDAGIRAAFAALPSERRKVVSSHDAFGYFGPRLRHPLPVPGRGGEQRRADRAGRRAPDPPVEGRKGAGCVHRERRRSAPDRAHPQRKRRADRRYAVFGRALEGERRGAHLRADDAHQPVDLDDGAHGIGALNPRRCPPARPGHRTAAFAAAAAPT